MTNWKGFKAERHDRSEPEVTVWRLSGTLTNSKETYEFLEQLRGALARGPRPTVLSLENVDHVTSAGVGILAAAYTSAVNAKVRLTLAALPNQVRAVLNILNLLTVIESAETEEQAVDRAVR